MYHCMTYKYINFQQNRVSRSGKIVHTNVFAKNHKLHKFAITYNNFEKKKISDMHHGVRYMYINFQQNRASRSVKTEHTTLFAKNHKLHKFATCNTNFEKSLISDMNYLIFYI